jgi:hypothetical protein
MKSGIKSELVCAATSCKVLQASIVQQRTARTNEVIKSHCRDGGRKPPKLSRYYRKVLCPS